MALRCLFANNKRDFRATRSTPALRAITVATLSAWVALTATACAGNMAASQGASSRSIEAVNQSIAFASAPNCGSFAAATRDAEAVDSPLVTFDSAWTIIYRTHWDTTFNGVNWLALRDSLRPRAAASRTRGELRETISAMLSTLRQSHFRLLPAEQIDGGPLEGTVPASNSNGSGWPGMSLRYLGGGGTREGGTREGSMVVSAVDTGGPAWAAGVRTGWTLSAIRGCSVSRSLAEIPTDTNSRRRALEASRRVMAMLAGSEGERVPLTFRKPDGRISETDVVYGEPPGSVTQFGNLPPMLSFLTWRRIDRGGQNTGLIAFNNWMPLLASRFDTAMDSLRNSDAIVLDLRGNPGGLGTMVAGIGGHFTDSVVLLGTEIRRDMQRRLLTNPRRIDSNGQPVKPFDGPFAIVVDELSGSTTEIFASGMQAVGRARVFGTRTAGQALPAAMERLPNGDVLYHAIANFLNPSGAAVEGGGVLPDVVTPITLRSLVNGQDPALDAALAWAAASSGRAAK